MNTQTIFENWRAAQESKKQFKSVLDEIEEAALDYWINYNYAVGRPGFEGRVEWFDEDGEMFQYIKEYVELKKENAELKKNIGRWEYTIDISTEDVLAQNPPLL